MKYGWLDVCPRVGLQCSIHDQRVQYTFSTSVQSLNFLPLFTKCTADSNYELFSIFHDESTVLVMNICITIRNTLAPYIMRSYLVFNTYKDTKANDSQSSGHLCLDHNLPQLRNSLCLYYVSHVANLGNLGSLQGTSLVACPFPTRQQTIEIPNLNVNEQTLVL